jgi:tetratricopeptide (TPR) repeat protein
MNRKLRATIKQAAPRTTSTMSNGAYPRVLDVQTRTNADSTCAAGIAAHQRGDVTQAEALYRQAIEWDRGYAEAFNNLGVLLDETSRPEEAEACYRSAISSRSGYVDALRNLGVLLNNSQRLAEAERAFGEAIALDASHVTTHLRLAQVLCRQKRSLDAANSLMHVLALEPNNAQVTFELGLILEEDGQFAQAEERYRRTLELDTTHASAHHALARTLSKGHDPAQAEVHYREALRLAPDDANHWCGLGHLLRALQRPHESEACFREAAKRLPDCVEAWGNLGSLLAEFARYDEAERCYRRLLQIDPDSMKAWNNLGRLLEDLNQFDDAEDCYRRALSIDPERTPTMLNLGLLLLKTGRFEEGWSLYESRYAEPKHLDSEAAVHVKPALPFAEWQGESLTGRAMLVWCEQGFGDSLHFARYLPLLKQRGLARLTVACPNALKTLFEQIDGVDACVAQDAAHTLPAFDFWSFTMSLPLRFGTTLDTIPAAMPYLRAPAERTARWAGRFPQRTPKVGLVWAGDPRPMLASAHSTDRRRSLNALAFVPLLETAGVTFVSLQLGASTRPQIETLPFELRPLDPMDEVRDFADTAALIEQLDLVIAVDTSVAHLAGALNKPVWILSRFDGCWRWLADRDDSPWYPSARLFRQTKPGNWNDVIGRVTHALRDWVAGRFPDASREA